MIKSRTDEWKNTLHQDISNVFFVVYITQSFIKAQQKRYSPGCVMKRSTHERKRPKLLRQNIFPGCGRSDVECSETRCDELHTKLRSADVVLMPVLRLVISDDLKLFLYRALSHIKSWCNTLSNTYECFQQQLTVLVGVCPHCQLHS